MDKRIDLNCDLGESFGVYRIGNDEALLPLISSANIACGFHAGDAATMRRTVAACVEHGVAIGAHPGLPDLAGFGRREMAVAPREAAEWTLYQVGALEAIARSEGGRLQHVKPHGALYNMAARDPELAEAIVGAIQRYDPELVVFGLAGSELIRAAKRAGLRAAHEVFADRAYGDDGHLLPRSRPGAVIDDPGEAAAQVETMLRAGEVVTAGGRRLPIHADTVCLHGDGANALAFARAVRERLAALGVGVSPIVAFP